MKMLNLKKNHNPKHLRNMRHYEKKNLLITGKEKNFSSKAQKIFSTNS